MFNVHRFSIKSFLSIQQLSYFVISLVMTSSFMPFPSCFLLIIIISLVSYSTFKKTVMKYASLNVFLVLHFLPSQFLVPYTITYNILPLKLFVHISLIIYLTKDILNIKYIIFPVSQIFGERRVSKAVLKDPQTHFQ